MSNKTQTAVEWLINELHKKLNGEGSELSYEQIFNKAKQLEAEQKEKYYSEGYDFGCAESRFNYDQDNDEWN